MTKIDHIETLILDIPTIRGHVLSMATMRTQTAVLVRFGFADGSEGIGEGTTIGGLSYGAESPESIRSAIDSYIAPALIGRDCDDVNGAIQLVDRLVKGNRIAKAAVEIALWDGLGKRLGVSVAQLFGGAVHQRLPVAWTLASGNSDTDIAEALAMIETRRHNIFKLKIGKRDVRADVAHVARIKAAVGDAASVRVDVNTAWTLQDARWGLKGLQDAGCELVEQPVPARHRRAMAELAAGYEIAVMADEALGGPEDALEVAQARAADVFAVKVAQSGGLKRAAEVVAIAQAAGLGLYGGTMLETGLGTAAALQLFATVETLHWGCEFFGPLLLTDEILANLNALINACSHRGAQLCRFKRRNQKTFTCPFHGWTFSNTGKLLKVKDPNGAGYPEQFNKDGSHDLTRVARFENYRGFLFGSLNADVQPLEEYLGEARKMIDMIVDQADEGLEVLRGSSTYTYDGNWKLQAENGADGYHVSAVHWNYVATTAHRTDDGKEDAIKATDASKWAKQRGGFHAYDIGHILLWTQWADPTNRPNYPRLAEWTERFGKTKADWMVGVLRNLCLYPNVFLMDQFSSQIRVFRPVSVDKTEVTIYCIAPKGEAPDARARRIRQYEDFFNASGMATPDDTEEFRATQRGHAGATHAPWNDLTRGAVQWIKGPDADASALGINPILSGARTEDEGLFVIQHTNWSDRTAAAVARERATGPAIATAAE